MLDRILEEIATEMLAQYAREHNTTLYRMGIIDKRRRYSIDKREIQMSRIEKRQF